MEPNEKDGGKKISALGDLIFHKTFASEANVEILAGLTRDIYGIEPKSVTILDPYDIRTYWERNKDGTRMNRMRHTRKDIRARLETSDLTIELQVEKDNYFVQRSLKYLSETYVGNYNQALREGVARTGRQGDAMVFGDNEAMILSRYASLRPVYSLNIVNFTMFRDEFPLRVLELYDPKRGLSLDKEWLSVAYFELRKPHVETEHQGFWRDYFLGNPLPERAPEYIRKAAKLLDYANLTQEERKMFDRDEYAQSAYESELYTSWCIGHDEGKAEGKLDDARRMNADGMDPALIEKYTGLSKEKIEEL